MEKKIRIDEKLFDPVMSYKPNGEAIRQRRLALNLMQKDLAQRAGCSSQHLCDIELGKRDCSLELAERISEVLKRGLGTIHPK